MQAISVVYRCSGSLFSFRAVCQCPRGQHNRSGGLMNAKTIDRYYCISYSILALKTRVRRGLRQKGICVHADHPSPDTSRHPEPKGPEVNLPWGEGKKQRGGRLPRASPSAYLLSGTYLKALFANPKFACPAISVTIGLLLFRHRLDDACHLVGQGI